MNNCCNIKKKSKKCIRKDGKIFKLPRKYTRKQCRTKKGFSKKSSCSPFKYCKTIKGGGPKEEYSFILKQKLGEGEKGIYQPEIQKLILSNIPDSKLTPGYMLARKEFLKMRQKHEENKIRNKKISRKVKIMEDEKFLKEVRDKVNENLKKISQKKNTEKKAPQETRQDKEKQLEKQKKIDNYNRKRETAKEQLKEIQERPVSRRTRSQTKQNREELKKLEPYVTY